MFNSFKASYQESLKFLQDYISSLPEEEGWKDFITSATGQTHLELISSLATFLQFEAQYSRYEVYPNTSKLRTSLVNLACAFGYSVNRPCCAEIQINFTADSDKTVSRFETVGSVNSAPLCVKEDVYIEAGKNYTLTFLVGEWKRKELEPVLRDFGSYIIEDEIDNNYVYFKVDGEQIDITKEIEWLDENSVADITTPSGLAIWLGNGELGYKIPSDDSQVILEYLSPTNISEIGEVSLQLGTVNSFNILSNYVPEDSIFKLTRIITGYRTARRLAVTEEGHRYIVISYSGIIDAYVYKDLSAECCQINVVYLREDKSLMNDTEKAGLLDYIYKYALIGVTYVIEDPVSNSITFDMTVYVESEADISEIEENVNNYFEDLSKSLGTKIYLANIIRYIESISGVTRCYIHEPVNDIALDPNEYLDYTLDISYKIDDGSLDHYGT